MKIKNKILTLGMLLGCVSLVSITSVNAETVDYFDGSAFTDKSEIIEDLDNLNIDRMTYCEQKNGVSYDRTIAVAVSEGYLKDGTMSNFVYCYNPYKVVKAFKSVKINDSEYEMEYMSTDYVSNISKFKLYESVFSDFTENRIYKIENLVDMKGSEAPQSLVCKYLNSDDGKDVSFSSNTLVPISKTNVYSVHFTNAGAGRYGTEVNQSLHILNFSTPKNYPIDDILNITIAYRMKLTQSSGDRYSIDIPGMSTGINEKEPKLTTTLKDWETVSINKNDYYNLYKQDAEFKKIEKVSERFEQSELAEYGIDETYWNDYEWSVVFKDTENNLYDYAQDLNGNAVYCGWQYNCVDGVVLDLRYETAGVIYNAFAVNQTEPEIKDPVVIAPDEEQCSLKNIGVCFNSLTDKAANIMKIISGVLTFVVILWVGKFVVGFIKSFFK